MKLKKFLAIALVGAMTTSLAACGSSTSKDSSSSADKDSASSASSDSTESASGSSDLNYADIELGKSFTDVKTTIKLFNHRTDMSQKDYNGETWDQYVADFNKLYPNIKVEVETDTNYADDALTRLQGGDWGDIMMIPAVDKSDLSTYFLPYGDLKTMQGQINYATAWEYKDVVYGVPSIATAQGIVYNKKVFEEAGITTLPKTPDEFITDLQAIKDKTDATPLYTNYAAGWTMGAWDAYIGSVATGDNTYMNQKLVHTKDPFQDYGDGTHANAVYKVLYDAVSKKLTEDDYSTTDWEGSKTQMNQGKIGCMVLGSWAFPQMQAAGANADDIGYMAFPISVNGKQYTVAGADYSYGINKDASKENQEASMVFVKWMTEKSGFQ